MIAGGGVAALETALALRDLAEGLVDVTLVAASDRFTFAPASVGVPFGKASLRRFDMFRIANDLGIRLVVGRLASVDTQSRRVILEDGDVLEYGALVIACGAEAREAVEGATTFRGPGDIDQMSRVLADVREGRASRLMFALPASLGWALPLYELCLLTGQYLAEKGGIYRYPNGNMRREFVEIGVVTPEASPLEAFGAEAGRTHHVDDGRPRHRVPPAAHTRPVPRRSAGGSARRCHPRRSRWWRCHSLEGLGFQVCRSTATA